VPEIARLRESQNARLHGEIKLSHEEDR
jgi:hypothetical protein